MDVRGSGQRGLVLLQLALIMKRLFSPPCVLFFFSLSLVLPGKKWVNVVNAMEEISLWLSPRGFRGHRQVYRVVLSGAGSDSVSVSLSLSRTLELGGCLLISVNLDYPVE